MLEPTARWGCERVSFARGLPDDRAAGRFSVSLGTTDRHRIPGRTARALRRDERHLVDEGGRDPRSAADVVARHGVRPNVVAGWLADRVPTLATQREDRKSTRLNSSHVR